MTIPMKAVFLAETTLTMLLAGLVMRTTLVGIPGTGAPRLLLGVADAGAALAFTMVVLLVGAQPPTAHDTALVGFLRHNFLHCLSAQVMGLLLLLPFLRTLPFVAEVPVSARPWLALFETVGVIAGVVGLRFGVGGRVIIGVVALAVVWSSPTADLVAYACLAPACVVMVLASRRLTQLAPAAMILSIICFLSAVTGTLLIGPSGDRWHADGLIGAILAVLGAYGITVSTQLANIRHTT